MQGEFHRLLILSSLLLVFALLFASCSTSIDIPKVSLHDSATTKAILPPEWTSTPTPTQIPTSTGTPTLEPTPKATPLGGGGGLIAFVSSRYGSFNIFTIDIATGEETQHSFGDEYVYDPFWSPNGDVFVFTGKVFKGSNYYSEQIFLVDISSGNTIQITNEDESIAPSWSPKGDRLAFLSSRDGSWALYSMNIDGTSLRKSTDGLGFIDQPYWSPVGEDVILADRENIVADKEIIKINLREFGYQNLTNNDDEDFDPSWSPDGKIIAFMSNRDGTLEIYLMEADGSNPIRLTSNTKSENLPRWSPDGTQIVFQAFSEQNWDIYIMKADGTDLVRLTDHPAPDLSPVWSPDGRMVAFVSLRDDEEWGDCRDTRECNSEIYIVNVATAELIRLTQNSEADVSPSWQPVID